jgi:hypothetical protein
MRIFALEESTQNIVRFGDKVQFVSIIYLKILDEGIMGCDDDIFVLHVFHLNSEFLSGMGCHTRSRHTRLLFAPSSWSTSYHEEIKTDNKQLILKLVLHQFTRESDGSTTTTSRSSRQSPLRQASNNLFVPASAHLFIPVVVSKSTNQCQFQYVLCEGGGTQRSTGPRRCRGPRPERDSTSEQKLALQDQPAQHTETQDGYTGRSTARHMSLGNRAFPLPQLAATYCTYLARSPETDETHVQRSSSSIVSGRRLGSLGAERGPWLLLPLFQKKNSQGIMTMEFRRRQRWPSVEHLMTVDWRWS